MPTRSEELAAKIHAATLDVRRIQAQIDDMASRMSEDPGDTQANEKLPALLVEQEEAQNKVKMFEAAQRGATARDALDARKAERAAVKKSIKEILVATEARVALGEDLAKHIAAAGECLVKIGRLSADAAEETARVGRLCYRAEWLHHAPHLVDFARGEGGHVSAALITAVMDAGFGRLGVRIPGFIDSSYMRFTSTDRAQCSLAGAFSLEVDRLREQLERAAAYRDKLDEQADNGVVVQRARRWEEGIRTPAELSAGPAPKAPK